ncbi:hypothetical protein IE53DRAFT_319860 [Violaceomyces palustris]|uniref:Uncharacterized protein n=1 Tax=Violaceomyces palustris TaxID=1673888 RepID=A0ACD0NQV0_9BASI|nr:hypothetical protein IE53DRAFT_319860 [Violaceomyces palustris]
MSLERALDIIHLCLFQVSCANELFTEERKCPACDTTLNQPDDVVVSSLNPSPDYRTSVLAGLSPSIIMEIATKALQFWQYQVRHAIFQSLILKNVQEKNSSLEKKLKG